MTVHHCLTHTSDIADDADKEAGEDYENGINAGVCSYDRHHPATDTTCILLANRESDVREMQDELEPRLSSA